MILIIKTNFEILHDLEFVKPIENILSKNKIKSRTIHYKELNSSIIKRAKKIIICGTALRDNEYLKDLDKFEWIKNFKKPLLGICSGMQIISLVYGSYLKEKTEIGFYPENFKKEFLGLYQDKEVYHLHNNYTLLPYGFEKFTKSDIPQAIKHNKLPIYGILFHPEVRNEKMVLEFCRLKK